MIASRRRRLSKKTARQVVLIVALAVQLSAGIVGCRPDSSSESDVARGPQPGNPAAGENPADPKPSDSHPSGPGTSATNNTRATLLHFEELSADEFPQVIARNGQEQGYATILESLGSGCAAIDIDHDGWDDVLVAGGGRFGNRQCLPQPLSALLNRRQRFQNVTAAAIDDAQQARFYNHGLAATDYDQDGFVDVLLTGYGGVQLFRNQGDGTFAAPQPTGLNSQSWSASAAWADFNGDRNPDVFVVNYVDWSFDNDPPCFAADGTTRDNCSPKLFAALPDELYLSHGDGTFEEASAPMNVRPDGKGLGIVVGDIDQDGNVDAYVGNDVMLNFLYRGTGGPLEDRSRTSGACVSRRGTPDASMGIDVADFDGDLRPDLWAANFELENFALYRNQGQLLFRHSSDMTGVSAIGSKYVGWGSALVDLDLDADVDIAVCNGHVVQYPEHAPVRQAMIVLENQQGQYFDDVAALMEATAKPRNGRGLAVTDWDRDGRPDLVISPVNEPAALLHNQTSTSGRWLQVDLVGTRSPRHAVGAVLTLTLSDGRQLLRLQKSGSSYASSSTATILFGFAEQQSAESLSIAWPSGVSTEYHLSDVKDTSLPSPSGGHNQRLVIVEPVTASAGDRSEQTPDPPAAEQRPASLLPR